MNKILLVIQREYLVRVRKKSFLIMTFLGPLLMGGLLVATLLMNKVDKNVKVIAVLDQSHLFQDKFKNTDRLQFLYLNDPLDSLRRSASSKGIFGILFIPSTSTLDALQKGITLYSESQPGLDILNRIESTLEKEINNNKYKDAGIDPDKLQAIRSEVAITTRDLDEKETNTPLASGLGFTAGILIYLFIFIYGAMVMRGVLEEKSSRIVEVIISSVKPFQLMMGKIIGIALVGLTQFLLWVVLTSVIYSVAGGEVLKDSSASSAGTYLIQNNELQPAPPAISTPENFSGKISHVLESINFPLMIGMFIFYFLGGYLLYAALFAAIGAAVDTETDVQQFMFPVTLPLILSYIAAVNVLDNPQGNIAFWFSIIPFTSPIIMMVRLPFGVPWEHVLCSMVLLVAGFIFTTWLAGKIYRTGILMYGKKATYRELWKWIKYSR